MSRTALSLSTETRWTMMSGSSRGDVQQLPRTPIVIGRSSECNIIISDDPKCSRKHAQVDLTQQGYEIHVLSESNGIKVNGKDTDKAVLNDGDVISVGDTDIRFNVVNTTASTAVRVSNTNPVAKSTPAWTPQVIQGHAQPAAIPQPQYDHPRPMPPPAAKRNYTRFYLYGGIILVGIWLFSGNNASKKKKELAIRTQEQIEQDIEAAKKMKEAAQALRKAANPSQTFEMKQAQEFYVKGFRDFRKGQYERSLESFRACLALFPDHQLCNRYLRLSQRKFNELIQYHMVLGRKYRDQEQYRACRAAFQNVTAMVNDPSSAIYKEAKANWEACNTLVEGTF